MLPLYSLALQSNIKKQQKTSEEIGELLDQLGKLLDRTKVMYEQYFMGIQKLAPAQLHRDIERRIRDLTQMQIRNTALRFRFATLSQKFGSYNTYWKRTMRQIDRGEYIRDVARAGRRLRRKGEELPEELLVKLPKRMRDRIIRDREALARREERKSERQLPAGAAPNDRGVFDLGGDDDLDLDAIFRELEADSPAPASREPEPEPEPVAPARARRSSAVHIRQRRPAPTVQQPAPAVRPPPGMTESQGRDLFEKYAKARRLVGDSRPVTYDQLMAKLGQQAPKIMRDHNARSVDFSVVIKGDKVVLKAKPKS